MLMTHAEYMRRAMVLAARGQGQTSPNPMVGCVIVKGRRVIAEAWHKRCGADHAEAAALKKAGLKAYGARMYVTLEPCAHFGRTPPCVDDIIACGIKEIFIGMRDPNPLTNGRSIARLKRAGIRVHVGLLEQDLCRLNEVFVKYITTGLPFVTAKCAQTLDGKIATASGDSRWVTSSHTRDFTHRLRGQFDAIVVGINTVLRDDPRLDAASPGKRIKKIILDSTLRISPRARLFRGTRKADVIIATTSRASGRKIIALERRATVIVAPSRPDGQINLKLLFRELTAEGITSILMEGGSQVIGSALRAGLVDKMHVFIAPKILGDQEAISAIRGLKPLKMSEALTMKRWSVLPLQDDLFLEAYV